MLTSGSTGFAKAVPLRLKQMLSATRGKSTSWGSTPDSVFLNWIGLDHVADLMEIHLHAMLLGAEQVHVQATDLLADPLLFVRLLSDHKVNFTFGPNFFLALLDKSLATTEADDPVSSADLSALKSIMSGGEANVVKTANEITKRLQGLGAIGEVIRLGYGLTEACAALAYGMLDPTYEDQEEHEFASIGKPIPGAEMRFVASTGSMAAPYEVGGLEISGLNVFQGYYNDVSATKKAFSEDGWFLTGDRAYIDKFGKFNLVGRSKEVILVNGVQYAPQDIENALERAHVPGTVASYFAVFSHRPKAKQTEGYCVVYGISPHLHSPEQSLQSADAVSRIASTLIGVRPEFVIPLPLSRLSKSSLGKLSRTILQMEFERGVYEDAKVKTVVPQPDYGRIGRVAPDTQTEATIVRVISAMVDLPEELISVDRTVFELGVTSITLFTFEKLLRKSLNIGTGVSIITFLSNPVIRAIANAIENQDSRQYNPVAQLQARGDKTPLWLVHLASGNVLAFLPLARTVTDRPLYALTA